MVGPLLEITLVPEAPLVDSVAVRLFAPGGRGQRRPRLAEAAAPVLYDLMDEEQAQKGCFKQVRERKEKVFGEVDEGEGEATQTVPKGNGVKPLWPQPDVAGDASAGGGGGGGRHALKVTSFPFQASLYKEGRGGQI